MNKEDIKTIEENKYAPIILKELVQFIDGTESVFNAIDLVFPFLDKYDILLVHKCIEYLEEINCISRIGNKEAVVRYRKYIKSPTVIRSYMDLLKIREGE